MSPTQDVQTTTESRRDDEEQRRREQDARVLRELAARENISQDVDRVRDRVEMALHEAQGARQQAQQSRSRAQQAYNAARQAQTSLKAGKDDHQFSILVSCIGRKLLMGQRTSDETEAAAAELGTRTLRLGFYSYGEISPHAKSGICELHNQTMTVTTFAEVRA